MPPKTLRLALLGLLVAVACSPTTNSQPKRPARTAPAEGDPTSEGNTMTPPQKSPPPMIDSSGQDAGSNPGKPMIDAGVKPAMDLGSVMDAAPVSGCGTLTYDGVCESGRVKYCAGGNTISYVDCGPSYPCAENTCEKGAACCPAP